MSTIRAKHPRIRRDGRHIDVLATLISSVVLFLSAYPIWYALINSLNDASKRTTRDSLLWPANFTLDAYAAIVKEGGLFSAFFVSTLRTVSGSLLHLLVTSMAAYVLVKSNLIGKKFFTVFFLISMYFSGGLIPTYLLLTQLGLLNNFLVYILPAAFSYYNALLMMAFFRSLPDALEESALLDGAGHFTIYRRIILPLSKPILATVILFNGVYHWTDWFSTLFYTTNRSLTTLSALIMRLLSQTEAQSIISGAEMAALAEGGTGRIKMMLSIQGIRYAAAMVAILPVVLVYPFIQRYFVKGIMLGAVKA